MGTRYLLDTNTVIDFSANKLPTDPHNLIASIIDNSPAISVINKMELLSFQNVSDEVVLFVEAATVISINDKIVNETINLRRRKKIKLPDAIIAATALTYDLVLLTHNLADFKNIEQLKVADSYTFA